jgi:hypothetical protein
MLSFVNVNGLYVAGSVLSSRFIAYECCNLGDSYLGDLLFRQTSAGSDVRLRKQGQHPSTKS